MLERSCLACRKKACKQELLRFINESQQLVWDRGQKLPGRGAYLHVTPECCAWIRQAKIWKRAFRTELSFEISQLEDVHRRISREMGFKTVQDTAGGKSKIRL